MKDKTALELILSNDWKDRIKLNRQTFLSNQPGTPLFNTLMDIKMAKETAGLQPAYTLGICYKCDEEVDVDANCICKNCQ